MALLALAAAQAALPGWVEVGPERGHVMDVAREGEAVLALTRIGVLRADGEISAWRRDPRFPVNTQLLGSGSHATWAVAGGGVWRVGEELDRVATIPAGGAAVDLVSTAGGGAIVAVRGEARGLWRLDAGGEFTRVLEVDPWRVAADGAAVWAATLGAGLWVSNDAGRSFTAVVDEGTASGVAVIDGEVWVGWDDGRVTRGEDRQLACTLPGPAIALARAGGRVVAVVDSADGPLDALHACSSDAASTLALPAPTGLWPLGGGRALAGTFREGPFLVDEADPRPVRTGFRAALASAVAQASDRLVVAFMSTGVFETHDGGASWTDLAGHDGRASAPVTDALDVAIDGERLLVVDFQGISVGRDGAWYRTQGVYIDGGGRPNALVQVAVDGRDRLWGRDYAGGLWLGDAGRWRRCVTDDAVRLEGWGDRLVLATATRFLAPSNCDVAELPAWPTLAVSATAHVARTDGRWLGTPGALLLDGRPVATLPRIQVRALAARTRDDGGEEVLVAMHDGTILGCGAEGCQPATRPLPEPVLALGWLDDGRVWVVEERGTMLVSAGDQDAVAVADRSRNAMGDPVDANVHAPSAAMELAIPPWRGIGRANYQVAGTLAPIFDGVLPTDGAPPEGLDWRWLVVAGEAVAVAFGVGAVWRLRQRPRRRRGRRWGWFRW